MDLFDLYAKITLDDSNYKKGMSSAKTEGAGLSSSLMKNMKSAVGAIAAVGAGAIALGGMFVKAALSVSDYGSTVNDMSQRLGISAKGYQQWNYILGQSGGNIESLQIGMKTLSEAVVSGSGAFKKIGLDMKDVKKMSQEELFNATINQLAGMEAGAERTSLANDLFGKSAIGLMPILNEGADGIEKMKKQAEDYGLIMSDSAVAASDAFGDSVSLMKQTLLGMKNRMMAEFLPALTQVTDGLALLFTGDTSGLDGINSGMKQFFDQIAKAVPKIVELGGSLLTAFVGSIFQNFPILVDTAFKLVSQLAMFILDNLPMLVETAAQIITTINLGVADQLPTLIPTIIDVVLTIINTLVQNLPLLTNASVQLMIGLTKGLINAIPILVQMIPQILISMVAALIGQISVLIQAGQQLGDGVMQGMQNASGQIKVVIGNMINSNILAPLTQAWGQLVSIGGNVVKGLWQGISNGTSWIFGKIAGWVGSVIAYIKKLFGIKSPSTVMRDEVGGYLPAGVAVGITRKKSLVERAWDGIRDVVTQSIPVSVSADVGSGGSRGVAQLFRDIIFNVPVGSPVQTADRIARELTGMLYT